MKVIINKNRSVAKSDSKDGNINENNYEILQFVFPAGLEDYTKYIEIEAQNDEGTLRYVDRIEDDKFALSNSLTKYDELKLQVICKDLNKGIVFKSNIFTASMDNSLNIMEDIEEEQKDLLDRIELELQEAKVDIGELQQAQTEQLEMIQANATDIEALEGRVSTNETDIDNLETDVSNIKQEQQTQNTNINKNTNDIVDIQTEQSTQNTNIASNTNRIALLEHDSGNKVTLSIDSNYAMTLQLLNKANEVLSTGTIDLPIESMVVNASYSNGILTLTLQNGNTLDVDISAIVSGLVSETTFNSAVSRLDGLISGLDTRMTTAETNIATLQTNVATNTQDITEIKTEQTTQNENIQENTDSIEALEAKHNEEVAELNEKIADLQEELDMTADLIPTDTPEPSTNITINDSARYTFKQFVVGGNSEQESYDGGNILNSEKFIDNRAYQLSNGVMISSNAAWAYNDLIKRDTNSVILSLEDTTITANVGRIFIYNNNKEYLRNIIITELPFTLDLENIEYYTFHFAKEYVPFGSNIELKGQASPNPDYPQEIRNVGDNVNIYNKETMPLQNGLWQQGGEFASTSRGYYVVVPVESNKTYTVTRKNSDTDFNLLVWGTTEIPAVGVTINEKASGTSVTEKTITTSSATKYLWIGLYGGNTPTEEQRERIIEELQVKEGSTVLPYSPYNCGSVDVKVQSLNLIPFPYKDTTKTVNGITYTVNDDRSIKVKGTATGTASFSLFEGRWELTKDCIGYSNNNTIGTVAYIKNGTTNLSYKAINNNVFNKGDVISRIYIQIANGNTVDLDMKLMLTEGTTRPTEYVKHEEQTVTFPTQEGQVIHLGDTLEDDGVHQRRNKYIFTGNEDFTEVATNTNDIYRLRTTVLANLAKPAISSSSIANILCNCYLKISSDATYTRAKTGIALGTTASLFIYDLSYSAQGSAENFKAFLAEQYANGTPVTVEYELAEEIIVPYTEAQQEAYDEIKALYSYKGTTHISSDNNPSPIFTVTYRKDIEAMIDNLNNAIVALGGV